MARTPMLFHLILITALPEFHLLNHEFIPLDKLLKITGLVESGGEAHLCIDAGEVKVNGKTELRRRNKLHSGDVVVFRGQEIEIK
jgi:ribosome-associated protein